MYYELSLLVRDNHSQIRYLITLQSESHQKSLLSLSPRGGLDPSEEAAVADSWENFKVLLTFTTITLTILQ